jgi:glycosyltransferase involved in cell wall biosynthesis
VRVFHRQHIVLEERGAKLGLLAGRLSHLTVACSHAAGRAAIELDHVPEHRVRIVYNGARRQREVSDIETAELRARHAIPADAAVVSTVARLRPEKGLATLLDAAPLAARLLARPLHVFVVGSGPQRAELAARARAITDATIHIVGHQDDVAPWFALADVVAVPSYREAFGYTTAEAMAVGRPVVASAVGALTELIEHEVSGLLVPSQDAAALADGLVTLLADKSRGARMGNAARRRFEAKFTIDAMAPVLLQAWQDAMQMRRPRISARP